MNDKENLVSLEQESKHKMTVQEHLASLEQTMTAGEKITLDYLRELVDKLSVKDNIAKEDAVTILYSGEGNRFPNDIAKNGGSSVRMLDHTEVYELLSDHYPQFKQSA